MIKCIRCAGVAQVGVLTAAPYCQACHDIAAYNSKLRFTFYDEGREDLLRKRRYSIRATIKG